MSLIVLEYSFNEQLVCKFGTVGFEFIFIILYSLTGVFTYIVLTKN